MKKINCAKAVQMKCESWSKISTDSIFQKRKKCSVSNDLGNRAWWPYKWLYLYYSDIKDAYEELK